MKMENWIFTTFMGMPHRPIFIFTTFMGMTTYQHVSLFSSNFHIFNCCVIAYAATSCSTIAMPATAPANARPWPAHREACGYVELGAHLGGGARRLAARCHVQRGEITLWRRTGADDKAFPQELLRISSPHFTVSVSPGHHNVFILSSQDGDRTEEVYCYTADQTARNKWIAVFRRQGVAIYATRPNGCLSRVLDPISEI